MRKLSALIILFTFCLSTFAQAAECLLPQSPLAAQTFMSERAMATDVCAHALAKNNLPPSTKTEFTIESLLPMLGGCLMGAGDTVKTQLEGYAYLVSLFVKEIPLYVYKKIKNYLSKEDEAIATVDKICQENISVIDKAKRLALEYYQALKTFLKQVSLMLKSEYKSFFCYPKELQAKLICRMISTVFLIIYSPSNMIQGVSWVKAMPSIARMGMNFLIDSGPTVGNLYHKTKKMN